MVSRRRAPRRGSQAEDRAADVAAEYERIIERFTRWANACPDIRAATVVGSRARQDHPADEWADLDLVMFVDDPDPYIDDAGWVQNLGTPWLTFIEPTGVGDARERRILFEGGLDVDCAVIPSSILDPTATGAMPAAFAQVVRRGRRILLDPQGRLAAASPTSEATPPSPPSEREVLEVVNDFWYHAVWTAKHLRRGELWWAKGGCDGSLKDLLRQMLEWQRARSAPRARTRGCGGASWRNGRIRGPSGPYAARLPTTTSRMCGGRCSSRWTSSAGSPGRR